MSGHRVPEAPQWGEAALWPNKADEDIYAARLLLDGDAFSQASFHVQQALEKLLKALLVAARQDVRRTHDLDDLSAEANRLWPGLIPSVFPLAAIDRWYLTSRYPGTDDAPPSLAEVADALREVDELMTTIKAHFSR